MRAREVGRWAVLLLAVCAVATAAAAPDPRARDDDPGRPLLGERFRYGHMALVPRAFTDLVAIPANIPWWSASEWGPALSIGAAVTMMMFPVLGPSADARLQHWVDGRIGTLRPQIWNKFYDAMFWVAVGSAGFGVLSWGWDHQDAGLLELVSLLVEGYSVSQLYHVAFKLLLGREGPENGEGQGAIRGPLWSLRLYPAGTPSGHVAGFYGLVGVLATYYDQPLITLAAHFVGLVLSALMVVSDAHFVSDCLWGAAMGYAVGDWVVRHRSSTWRYRGSEPVRRSAPLRVQILPVALPRQGFYGMGAAVAF